MSGGQAAAALTARSAPTLETDRLVLRQFGKDDFQSYFAIVTDPVTMQHFSGPPMSREECWRRVSASVGSWLLRGFGGWAVTLRNGPLVGTVGLFNALRDLEPEFGDEPEMGWIFTRAVHGQGIAGEACQAVLRWADAALQPTAIWAIIAPSNAPSFRLAERLGFQRFGDTLYHDEPTAVLRRPPRG